MHECMRRYIRAGIVHFMAFPETIKGEGPILETLKKIAADDYFDVVEITWIRDRAVRKAAKKLLDSAGMAIAYGGQPRLLTTGLNINDLEQEARQRAVATLKEGIDEAYEMGATAFAFLSGKYRENAKDKALAALIESTNELCAYAASKGNMKVVHEVFDDRIDKKSLIGPAQLARTYAGEIRKKHANFGLMVDLSHMPLLGEKPADAILPVRDYIAHVHIGNCVVADSSMPGYGDQHPRFGFPGSENGVKEVTEFLRVLMDAGYLGKKGPRTVSFEVKPLEGEDPDAVIAGAKRVLNEAWARL